MAEHPHEYSPVSPYLMVDRGNEALEFYQRAFGADVAETYMHEGRLGHATLKINGGDVMVSDEFPEYQAMVGTRAPSTLGGTTCTISLAVDDVDKWHERAVGAGAEVLRAPNNEFYGRMSKLRDPFGHVWSFTGPISGTPS
ncbi:MAG TPA: VOC family protein [Caulobacteraceae bacterium]|jgi:PhnB protein